MYQSSVEARYALEPAWLSLQNFTRIINSKF